MRYFALAVLIISLAWAIDASVQIAKQTVTNETEEEEPHPYTISFFVFPHGAAEDLLDRTFTKKKTNHHKLTTNALKANATPDDTWLERNDEDIDSLYQRGSIVHPPSEMYPQCHQCDSKNSTFDGCTQKKTLKVCNKGLANICYTRSFKKGDAVHYLMGCATHKQCQHARAEPCKLSVKKCFTCCQWSGCNSRSHHHKNFPYAHQITTKLSFKATASANEMSWGLVMTSLLLTVLVVL